MNCSTFHNVINKKGVYSQIVIKMWRDRLGIEPSGDGTRLPEGFEVRPLIFRSICPPNQASNQRLRHLRLVFRNRTHTLLFRFI